MSIKLLVADDSITIQKVIGIIFGGEEYSLTVVDNGKTAIEKAREICPDVLLVDALMPGMTGYEVAEAIRATPALSSKPILILTGSFEPFDEDKAKKCGADDFLAKPFESQQIINKVKELLELGIAREKTASPATPPEAPLAAFTPETTLSSTPFTESFTDAVPQQEVVVPAAQTPTDIWNAFTFEPESPEPNPEVTTASFEPIAAAPSAPVSDEPDVFSIVSEESGSSFIQTDEVIKPVVQHIGSQWVPVEENTFEFEEDKTPDLTTMAAETHQQPLSPQPFGEISFEDDEAEPPPIVAPYTAPTIPPPIQPEADVIQVQPETAVFAFEQPSAAFISSADSFTETTHFEAPPETPQSAAVSIPEVPLTLPVTPAPAVLTEEQLKEALSAASKEVIERIVWEVVPDLAEALIKDAIRRIKEGI